MGEMSSVCVCVLKTRKGENGNIQLSRWSAGAVCVLSQQVWKCIVFPCSFL